MKLYKEPDYYNQLKAPRVEVLAAYYEMAELMLEIECRGNERYPVPNLFNKNSPVALWLPCAAADAIIERAGLKNPLFGENEQ